MTSYPSLIQAKGVLLPDPNKKIKNKKKSKTG